jgi:hypothetical protein
MDTYEKSSSDKNKASSTDNVKWVIIVFGIIIGLLLFKKEIGGLLERASEVKVTKDGIEIKSTITPVGETEITAYSDKLIPTNGSNDTTYVNQKYGFKITWPLDNNWFASETEGDKLLGSLIEDSTQNLSSLKNESVHIPILITKGKNRWQNKPSVNVVVYNSDAAIGGAMNSVLLEFVSRGWQIYLCQIDEETQSGIVVFKNPSSGDIIQIQRVVISDDYTYVITSSNIPPGVQSNEKLKGELRNVLNSFRLI